MFENRSFTIAAYYVTNKQWTKLVVLKSKMQNSAREEGRYTLCYTKHMPKTLRQRAMNKFTKKEKAFADELANYEDKWVAIERTKTKETIVASGDHFSDAVRAAEAKGVKGAVYRKVPSSTKILIA